MSQNGFVGRRVWVPLVSVTLATCLLGCGGNSNDAAALPGTVALRAALTNAVQVAAQGLGAVAVTGGVANQDTIRSFVHPVRFLDDASGYFFVYDYTTDVCVAHAINGTWEGTDKSDYQDSQGLFVIQELSEIARSAAGSGFLVYHWNNPVSGQEEEKLGYIQVIPGTTLYIGSGIYVGGWG